MLSKMEAALSSHENIPHGLPLEMQLRCSRKLLPADQHLGSCPCLSHFIHTPTGALGISALNFLFCPEAPWGRGGGAPPGRGAGCCGRRAAAPPRSPPACRSGLTPPARACCSGDTRIGAFSTGSRWLESPMGQESLSPSPWGWGC